MNKLLLWSGAVAIVLATSLPGATHASTFCGPGSIGFGPGTTQFGFGPRACDAATVVERPNAPLPLDALQQNIAIGAGLGGTGVEATGEVRHTEFDELDAQINPTFRVPGIEVDEVSVFGAGYVDLAPSLGISGNSILRVGVFAGHSTLDAEVLTTAFQRANVVGIGNRSALIDIDTDFYGVNFLWASGNWFATGLVAWSDGDGDIQNLLINTTGQYGTDGQHAKFLVGHVIDLGTRGGHHSGSKDDFDVGTPVKIALTLGVSYADQEADQYTDSAGNVFGRYDSEATAGELGARLYQEVSLANGDFFRPFVDVGVRHFFENDRTQQVLFNVNVGNQNLPNGGVINYETVDTQWTTGLGFDYITGTTKFFAQGYYRGSELEETYGARLGVSFKFDREHHVEDSLK